MKNDSKNRNTQGFFYTPDAFTKFNAFFVIYNKGVINIRCSYEEKKLYRV